MQKLENIIADLILETCKMILDKAPRGASAEKDNREVSLCCYLE